MKPSPFTALLFLVSVCVCAGAQQDSKVHGAVADQAKPVTDGAVYLQRLRDEKCAQLYAASEPLTKEERKELSGCSGQLLKTTLDANGKFTFETLEPGWYMLRINWPMAQPPESKKPVGCKVQGWFVSYVPWKESGKYTGFVQGPPFKLQAGDNKTIDFDYNADFAIQKDCPKPLKWQKQ